MSYSRPPNIVAAGVGLKQSPQQYPCEPSGIVISTLSANIATTTSLGVVQVGSGLDITPAGVLSATGSGSDLINVKLVDCDYLATLSDYYIGAVERNITITLPLGVVGKVYYIKNQVNGNIKVEGSGGQKLDTSSFKTLGSESAIIVVFDGTRWNII